MSAYEIFSHLVLGMSKSDSCGYLNFHRTPGSRFRSFENKRTFLSQRTSGSVHFKSIEEPAVFVKEPVVFCLINF
jgi:hypothetical protein